METLVIDRLKKLLTSPTEIVSTFAPSGMSPDALSRLVAAAAVRAAEIQSLDGGTKRSALLAMLDSIIVRADRITLHLRHDTFGDFRASGVRAIDDGMCPAADLNVVITPSGAKHEDVDAALHESLTDAAKVLEIHIAASFVLARGKTSLIINGEPTSPKSRSDKALVKALARAVIWGQQLTSGTYASVAEIARAEHVTDRYIHRLLPLAFLDPDLVAEIVEGQFHPTITVTDVAQGREIPANWAEQRRALAYI